MREAPTRILFGSIAAALITTAAMADVGDKDDESRQSAEAKFDSLDRNDDGRLSKSEVQEEDTLTAQFIAVDQNSDGYVSKAEYTAMSETRSSRPSEMQRQSPEEDRNPY